jgi:hypothetical protein
MVCLGGNCGLLHLAGDQGVDIDQRSDFAPLKPGQSAVVRVVVFDIHMIGKMSWRFHPHHRDVVCASSASNPCKLATRCWPGASHGRRG